jgi:hypothetical protein
MKQWSKAITCHTLEFREEQRQEGDSKHREIQEKRPEGKIKSKHRSREETVQVS